MASCDMTLGTLGCSQAQLPTEFHTTQSNVLKLLNNTVTGKVKTQLKRLHRQHAGTYRHTIWA